jgi:hypothetical protein
VRCGWARSTPFARYGCPKRLAPIVIRRKGADKVIFGFPPSLTGGKGGETGSDRGQRRSFRLFRTAQPRNPRPLGREQVSARDWDAFVFSEVPPAGDWVSTLVPGSPIKKTSRFYLRNQKMTLFERECVVVLDTSPVRNLAHADAMPGWGA